jgi:hypothetical protein
LEAREGTVGGQTQGILSGLRAAVCVGVPAPGCHGHPRRKPLLRRSVLAVLAILASALFAGAVSARADADPVIAAAGDIACSPSSSSFKNGLGTASECHQKYTSDLLVGAGLAAVLALGDNQYETGSLSSFNASFDPSWGRVKPIIRPELGNHEYKTSQAAGYFDYFNGSGNLSGSAGDRGKGYYSFDVSSWHLIALNTNDKGCGYVACGAGSAQEKWLRADLAAHPSACTLAYWHHPRFSSGSVGNASYTKTLWEDLYNARADVVLNGHAHDYERFAPQNPSGTLDRTNGIREFVVGTGGVNFDSFGKPKPNSEVRQSSTFGVLKLTLHATSYDWRFSPEAGKTFTDSGTGFCHRPSSDTQPPSTPTNLTAVASTPNRVDLSWTGSSDNTAVAGYKIFRAGAQIATSTTTSYADTTVQPGTTYNYYVVAYDGAGNTSAPSNTASVTTPAATFLAFTPTDDAYVEMDMSSSNFGSASEIVADNSPVKNFLLRFSVSGVGARQVSSAKLRLYCVDGSTDSGGQFHRTTSTNWSQSTVTWATAPLADPTLLASLGPVSSGRWYEVDLTSLVTADGTYSLRVSSPSSDGAHYASKERTGGVAPQLVVTAG